jgi:bifunctional non-homologous end joining protein LigD
VKPIALIAPAQPIGTKAPSVLWLGYPLVLSAIQALKVRSCLIDGEVTVCDGQGVSDFNLLRHGPWVKHEAVLFAFDLLELDGWDLTREPIEARKVELAKLLHSAPPSLRMLEHLQVEGAIVYSSGQSDLAQQARAKQNG